MLRVLVLTLLMPCFAFAQSEVDEAALADIRGELSAMAGEIEGLRALLLSEGGQGGEATPGAGPALLQIGQLEERIQALTGDLEQLRFQIAQIVADATNRFGDLEFRLTELEGGDISTLGNTPTLGGTQIAVATPTPTTNGDNGTAVSVAVGEEADFDAAQAAFEAEDMAQAAALYTAFVETYPGGPFSVEALHKRGLALSAIGQHKAAARSYLDAFTAAPNGTLAPLALMGVGEELAKLGRTVQACSTLQEVVLRYPQTDAAQSAAQTRAGLACEG